MLARLRSTQPYLWIGVLVLIGFWRFFQIRDLVLPSWVDSVHHTLLVRLLLEERQIPATWAPYLPDTPFYYHFGFHVLTALFAQVTGLTGLALGRAVLILGQIIQALFALAIYALGWTIWRSYAKALVAMLLIGFVSEMPAFYVTWGRYTLLTGLLFMVLALITAYRGQTWELGLLATVTAITHHYAFFLLYPLLGLIFLSLPTNRKSILIGGGMGLFLAGPWLIRVVQFGGRYARIESGSQRVAESSGQIWSLLGPQHNYYFLAAAGIGLSLVAARLIWPNKLGASNDRRLFPMAGFGLLLIALMGPWTLGPFRPDHAAIVLFLPAVFLAVEALWLLHYRLLISASVAISICVGCWYTWDIVRADTVLANQSDLRAIEWIDGHTAENATFLIDTEPWTRIWRGADGGWWIMPLTGRQTVMPPVAYSWSSPAIIQAIKQTAEETARLKELNGPHYCQSLQSLMAKTGANYYYSRDPRATACPGIEVVFAVDDIRIYASSAVKKTGLFPKGSTEQSLTFIQNRESPSNFITTKSEASAWK